jgi:hypothetical protein
MDNRIEEELRRLAGGRCEYCHLPEEFVRLKHVTDHIIARQHGGGDDKKNLAVCCGRCNRSKGPNIAGIDPKSGKLVRLFHPRRHKWSTHFHWDGPVLAGRTAIGRATIVVLAINDPLRVALRESLLREGFSLDWPISARRAAK